MDYVCDVEVKWERVLAKNTLYHISFNRSDVSSPPPLTCFEFKSESECILADGGDDVSISPTLRGSVLLSPGFSSPT